MSKNSDWVLGYHAITAVLETQPERATGLWAVSNSRNPKQASLLELAAEFGLQVHRVDKAWLSKQVGSDNHQGVALQAQARKVQDEKDLARYIDTILAGGSAPLILVLDQVQDPHNYGACLRTADAAGVDAVVVAKDNASPITSVVKKVASGATETLQIFRVTNLVRAMQALQQQGVWLVGTSDQAEQSVYEQDLTGATALVMGAEGKGMRPLTMKTCDSLVSLPMASKVVSSLNVSVATGVCLFEAVRQRQK